MSLDSSLFNDSSELVHETFFFSSSFFVHETCLNRSEWSGHQAKKPGIHSLNR